MNLEYVRKKLEKHAGFRVAQKQSDRAFEIGQMILEARIKCGFTQKQLAQKIRTKQPSIARIEGGAVTPTIAILEKIVLALKCDLRISLQPRTFKVNRKPTVNKSNPVTLLDFYKSDSLIAFERNINFSIQSK